MIAMANENETVQESQADQFASLRQAADAVDATLAAPGVEGAGPAPADPAPAGPDYQQEAVMMVEMFISLAVGYAPSTAAIWDDQTKARVSASLGPTLEYFGFTVGTMPPWVVTLLVAGPPMAATARGIAKQMASDKAKAAKPAPPGAPAAAAAAPGDSPETLVHPQMALYQ